MTKREAYKEGWHDGQTAAFRAAATLAAGQKLGAEALRLTFAQAAEAQCMPPEDAPPQADETAVLLEVAERQMVAMERLTAAILRGQGLDPDAMEGEE